MEFDTFLLPTIVCSCKHWQPCITVIIMTLNNEGQLARTLNCGKGAPGQHCKMIDGCPNKCTCAPHWPNIILSVAAGSYEIVDHKANAFYEQSHACHWPVFVWRRQSRLVRNSVCSLVPSTASFSMTYVWPWLRWCGAIPANTFVELITKFQFQFCVVGD